MTAAGGTIGGRREARERAIGLLYEAEQKDAQPTEVLRELPLPPDPYTERIVRGVGAGLAEIDQQISRHSQHWDLERMPALDRAILRMGVYELRHEPDVPTAVVINEAVDLAKEFSTDASGAFVNGLLSAVAAEVRTPRPDERPDP